MRRISPLIVLAFVSLIAVASAAAFTAQLTTGTPSTLTIDHYPIRASLIGVSNGTAVISIGSEALSVDVGSSVDFGNGSVQVQLVSLDIDRAMEHANATVTISVNSVCSDTDLGNDPQQKGSVVGITRDLRRTELVDTCTSSSSLTERFCTTDATGAVYADSIEVPCSNTCSDGACEPDAGSAPLQVAEPASATTSDIQQATQFLNAYRALDPYPFGTGWAIDTSEVTRSMADERPVVIVYAGGVRVIRAPGTDTSTIAQAAQNAGLGTIVKIDSDVLDYESATDLSTETPGASCWSGDGSDTSRKGVTIGTDDLSWTSPVTVHTDYCSSASHVVEYDCSPVTTARQHFIVSGIDTSCASGTTCSDGRCIPAPTRAAGNPDTQVNPDGSTTIFPTLDTGEHAVYTVAGRTVDVTIVDYSVTNGVSMTVDGQTVLIPVGNGVKFHDGALIASVTGVTRLSGSAARVRFSLRFIDTSAAQQPTTPQPNTGAAAGTGDQYCRGPACGVPGELVMGSTQPRVTVTIVGDLGSRFYHRFMSDTFPALDARYADSSTPVAYRWVWWPLSFDGDAAKEAARALACDAEFTGSGAFALHQALMPLFDVSDPTSIDAAAVDRIASEQFNGADITSCIARGRGDVLLSQHKRVVDGNDVTGVPWFFITNDRYQQQIIQGAQPVSVFERAIDAALAYTIPTVNGGSSTAGSTPSTGSNTGPGAQYRCTSSDETSYTCSDGRVLPVCTCSNGVLTCRKLPEDACGTSADTNQSSGIDLEVGDPNPDCPNGCIAAGECYPTGAHVDKSGIRYCSTNGTFASLVSDGQACRDDYACSSGTCTAGTCASSPEPKQKSSIASIIMGFLTRLFGR